MLVPAARAAAPAAADVEGPLHLVLTRDRTVVLVHSFEKFLQISIKINH